MKSNQQANILVALQPMDLSHTEENYIKAIFTLSQMGGDNVTTNGIAAEMNTTAASVSDMLKKLANKKLINYKKYHGVQLTHEGEKNSYSFNKAAPLVGGVFN